MVVLVVGVGDGGVVVVVGCVGGGCGGVGVGVDPGLGEKKSNGRYSFLAIVKSTNPTAPRPSMMLSVRRIKQIL